MTKKIKMIWVMDNPETTVGRQWTEDVDSIEEGKKLIADCEAEDRYYYNNYRPNNYIIVTVDEDNKYGEINFTTNKEV